MIHSVRLTVISYLQNHFLVLKPLLQPFLVRSHNKRVVLFLKPPLSLRLLLLLANSMIKKGISLVVILIFNVKIVDLRDISLRDVSNSLGIPKILNLETSLII